MIDAMAVWWMIALALAVGVLLGGWVCQFRERQGARGGHFPEQFITTDWGKPGPPGPGELPITKLAIEEIFAIPAGIPPGDFQSSLLKAEMEVCAKHKVAKLYGKTTLGPKLAQPGDAKP